MSIDMSQFYQVFFEETGEHLANMENLLLALDVEDPDAEQLNAIFRAAHSIKGSSGTFGFTDLQDVTHILENLLDRVRKGELGLRNDMIDAFLDAGDVLKNLLATHQGEGEADRAAAEAICQRLRQLTEDTSAPASAVSPAPTFAEPASDTGLDLHFVIDGSATDETIENLKGELARHGEVRLFECPATPDQPCHVTLIGAADPEVLRGLLEFVARNDSIRIEPLGESAAVLADAGDDTYGFFEPLPAAAAPVPVDDSFGFFEPLPEVKPAAPAASALARREVKPAPAAKPAAGETTIRVGVDKVDQLINLVGELVITQAMMAQAAAQIDPVEFERLHNGLI